MALKYTAILFTIFLLFVVQVTFVENLKSQESLVCCPKGKSNTASLTISKVQPGAKIQTVESKDCIRAEDIKVMGDGMGDMVLTAVVVPKDVLDQKRASGEPINADSAGCKDPTEFCMQTDSMETNDNCIVVTNVSKEETQISCDSAVFKQ
ncbi:7682_t:CDS:2 [Funneliformis geosporum]|uniref:11348_t:CDS:1 n=1 Tax=Funneliformis geosporum TaxID=1117311 RepID=A0A9W4WS07_9GLOM|nr:11348_t:CDS:2 [Funneliformis geosporum]CAI2181892.1 7682_t:CDS:2 [Funneliformis geosporum]